MQLQMAGNYEFSRGVLPSGVMLSGNAWLDPDFGVTLDGEGDNVCLGEHSAEGWTADGDFTIAFSFTKAHCYIPGSYEFLFSTFGDCPVSERTGQPYAHLQPHMSRIIQPFNRCT